MSRTALVLSLALLAAPCGLAAQTRADSAGIRQAASDYIDGWWTGNAERMTQALHPELVKRIMMTDSTGTPWIAGMGASQLIRGTRAGGGTHTPAAQQKSDIRVLDVFQNTALARIDAGAWVDYLELVRWRGRWVILNVLWELRQPAPR